jgi:predicted exporter
MNTKPTKSGRLPGIWLVFIAVCIFIISRSTFNADMSAFLPRSPTPTQQIMVDQLRDGVVSRLILIGVDSAPAPVLAQISKNMAAQLRGDSELVAVNNGERAGLEKDFELLWRNRYLLSDAVTTQRFTAQGLHDSLSNYLDLLGTPMSGIAQRVLPDDPSGELIHLLEQLEGQAHPAMQDDVWFSHDGARAMLLVQTKASGSDIDAQERAMQHIQTAFNATSRQLQATSSRLQMTGPGVFSVQSRAAIRDDAWRLSLIAMLLVAAMLLLLYRSPRALLLGLLPVVSGALAGVAAVSVGFGSVHGITLGFGVTLIGEGVDYAIYLFTQIEQNDTPQSTLRRIWPTLRLGVLTSICGFSAMLFSGFTGLAQLGLFSIAGLLAAVGTTRWVLPQLLPTGFSVRPPTRLSGALMSAVRQAPRARGMLLILVVAALALLMVKRDTLWNDNLASMSPVSKELQVLDQELRNDIGAPDVRYMLVLKAADQESVLQQSEAISTILHQQVQQGLLEGFDTPPLPSRHAQLARQAALPDAAAILQANLTQAMRDLPFRSTTFATFPQEIAAAKQQALLDRTALQGSNLGLKLDSLLLQRDAGWLLMLPLRGVQDAALIEQGIQRMTQTPFILLDMTRESAQMLHDYRRDASKYALLGALTIVALLFVSLRSARRVFEVTLPLIAAVIIVTAGLLLNGQSLSIFHLIGLLLVVAVGSNYALFFDQRCTSPQDRERTITSLLFANASTVLGFGLLSFSQSQVLSAIGTTVALGAVLSLVFSSILIVRDDT